MDFQGLVFRNGVFLGDDGDDEDDFGGGCFRVKNGAHVAFTSSSIKSCWTGASTLNLMSTSFIDCSAYAGGGIFISSTDRYRR